MNMQTVNRTLVEQIFEAAALLMWKEAVRGFDSYRQWFYGNDYSISTEAQAFIHKGISQGKSAQQIFDDSVISYR